MEEHHTAIVLPCVVDQRPPATVVVGAETCPPSARISIDGVGPQEQDRVLLAGLIRQFAVVVVKSETDPVSSYAQGPCKLTAANWR